ncbi:MAG: NUDIX pyrophosphatase [Bacteroidetes bacterium]|nr:NUDIX pyrophosphatase [Bacteroidota bacterium]
MTNISCSIVEVCIFSFENKEPQYLMLRRSLTEKVYPDIWQIVTGSIEQGETAVQGALRELNEETGYVPQKFWIVPHVNTFFSVKYDTLHHTVVFAAQVPPNTNPVLSDEHYQFEWHTIDKAKAMCVWPGQMTALQIVHEFIVSGRKTGSLSEIIL